LSQGRVPDLKEGFPVSRKGSLFQGRVPYLKEGLPTLSQGRLPYLKEGLPTLSQGRVPYLKEGFPTLAQGRVPHLKEGFPISRKDSPSERGGSGSRTLQPLACENEAVSMTIAPWRLTHIALSLLDGK